ncbi:MAG: hypothetical protein ACRDPJ_15995 [Nocardioidaceae bacterium]
MFETEASSVPICTVRRHPTGGCAPVLHLSHTPPPVPSPGSISFPNAEQAAQYAKNHYGIIMVRIADELTDPGRKLSA